MAPYRRYLRADDRPFARFASSLDRRRMLLSFAASLSRAREESARRIQSPTASEQVTAPRVCCAQAPEHFLGASQWILRGGCGVSLFSVMLSAVLFASDDSPGTKRRVNSETHTELEEKEKSGQENSEGGILKCTETSAMQIESPEHDDRDNSSPATLEELAAESPMASTGGGEGTAVEGGSRGGAEGEAAGDTPSTGQTQWLIMTKNAAQAKCKELESQLAATKEELTKRDTRFDKRQKRDRR